MAALATAVVCLSAASDVCATETFPYGGTLQANVGYTFDKVELSATFIPSATGEIIYNCAGFIMPYADSEHTQYIEGVWQNYIEGSSAYSINVTKDVPVYFFADLFDVQWNAQAGMIFKITENQPIEILGYSVEEGDVLSLTSGYGELVIYTNQPVSAAGARISVDATGTEVNIPMSSDYSTMLSVNYIDPLMKLTESDAVKGGEDISLIVRGITNNTGKLYDDGNDLVIKYKAPAKPVTIKNISLPDPFKAYWKEGNPDGVATVEYSGPISKADYLLKYGDFESEVPDGYIETGDSSDPASPAKITIDGNKLMIDFSGKSRTFVDMGTTMDYGNIYLSISAYDKSGEPVMGEGQGMVGGFGRELSYLCVTPAQFKTTFTPESGSSLFGLDNIYIHLWDYEKVVYTGVKFQIENGGTVVVPRSEITETGGSDFDWTLTIPIPEAVKKTTAKVTVTFDEVSFTDEDDHSDEFVAVYNGDGLTGITLVEESAGEAVVYTPDGRRIVAKDGLNALPRGIYIINGKKIIR